MKQTLILCILFCIYGCTIDSSDKSSESISSDTTYISPEDSIATTWLAIDFYSWYGENLKKDTLRAFDPVFIKDADGYTTLDFTAFEKHLQDLNFTADHIQRIKDRFNTCIENLKGVAYDSIQILQNEERMNIMGCYFTQGSTIWNYEMNGISGAEVIRIRKINSDNIHVIIHTYSDITYVDLDNKPVNTNRVFEEEEWAVQTIKRDNKWEIQEITLLPTKLIEE